MGRMHHTSPIASLYDVSCCCFSTSSYAVRNATAAELKESECPTGLPLPGTRTAQSDCDAASSSCSDRHRASVASDSSSCASAGLGLYREGASACEAAGAETSATLSVFGGQCQQSSSMSTTYSSSRRFSQIHGAALASASFSSLGNDLWGLTADETVDDLEPQVVIKNTFIDLVLPPSRNQPRRSKSMPHSSSAQQHNAAQEKEENERPLEPLSQEASLPDPEEAASTQVPVPDAPLEPQPWQVGPLPAYFPVPAWAVVGPCPAVAVPAGAAMQQQEQQQHHHRQQTTRLQAVEQQHAGAQDEELEGDAENGKHRQVPIASEPQAQNLISEACAAFREYRQSPVWPLSRKDRDSSALVQKAIDILAQELSIANEEGDRTTLDAASFRVEALLSGMHGHVHTALEHPHANYVIQKVVDVLPVEHLAFVISELRGKALWASKHRFGCRTVLRLVPHTRAGGWIGAAASQLLDEIMPYADELACDKFGNYVMQEVVEYGASYHKRALTRALLSGGIASSATTQHGSRVIEKALRMCDPVDVEVLAGALLGNRRVVQRLTSSEYGCLVLKPLVKSDEYARRSALVLRPWVPELRKTRQGRRLLSSVFGNSEPID